MGFLNLLFRVLTQGLDSELIELGNMGLVDVELDGLGDRVLLNLLMTDWLYGSS